MYIFLDSKVTSDLNESYEVTKKLLSKFSSFVLLWRRAFLLPGSKDAPITDFQRNSGGKSNFNSGLSILTGTINPLTSKSDWHLISLYHITPESNIEVKRMKELITN